MKNIVARNFIIYSLPSIVSKFIPFIVLPITTKYLNLIDFGNIAIFELCIIPFQILLGFGPGYVINSLWYGLNIKERGSLLFSLLLVGLTFIILGIVSFSIFKNQIFPLIAGEEWINIKDLFPFLLISAASIIPNNIFDSWIIIERKAKLSTAIKLSQIVIASITVILIAKYTQNFKYVIMGNVLVNMVIASIQVVCLSKALYFSLEKRWFILIYKISSPILLRSVFMVMRSQFDRILVSKLYGASQYAIYNFSGKVNNAATELGLRYQNAYDPIIYKGLTEKNLNIDSLRSILFIGSYFIILLGSILVFSGQYLINILTNNIFSDAYNLVILYYCTIVVTLPFMANGQVVLFYQKTKYLFIITVIQTVIIVILAVILVPIFGALGGIFSFWFGTLVYMLMYFYKKRQLYKEFFIEKMVLIYVVLFHIAVFALFINFNIIAKILLVVLMMSMSIKLYYMNKIFINSFSNKISNTISNIITRRKQ